MDSNDILDNVEPMAIRKQVDIEAPVERVWRYVGTEAGLAEWLMAEVTLQPEEGGRYEECGLYEGASYRLIGEVETYEEPLQISIALRQVPMQDDVGGLDVSWPAFTTLTITLRSLMGNTASTMSRMPFTRVTLEHSGFEDLPATYRRAVFDMFESGWSNLIERLPELVPLAQS